MRIFRRYGRILVALCAVILATAALARAADEQLPRFAILRAGRVNLRTGPGMQYPIEWVYERKGLPVEITATFDVWRQIRDSEGTVGWVQERLLTDARNVVIIGAIRTLRSEPEPNATPVARAEPGVIAHLLECRGAWCRVAAKDIDGWIKRNDVWGVRPDEKVP